MVERKYLPFSVSPMALKLHDALYCNFTNTGRITMFLGALERPESLVYNATKNIVIRPVFMKLQYKAL